MEKIKKIQFTNEYGLKDTWTYKGNRLIKTEFTYPRTNKKNKIMSEKQELFNKIDPDAMQLIKGFVKHKL